MVEGPYRTPPKGDEEFDPEKHVMVDKKSWVKKSAAETTKKAKEEAQRRNVVIEEPNWFFRLFGKTNKETYHSVLQEEALETEIAGLNYSKTEDGGTTATIQGIYKGYNIKLEHLTWSYISETPINEYRAEVNGVATTKKEAKKIWKRLGVLVEQREENRKNLKHINDKLETKKPVLEILGLMPQNQKKKELPETTEPKQLPEKTEE